MKNVTKTNILFTFMVAFYLFFVFILRLIPPQYISMNFRLILPEMLMLIPAFLYVTLLKPDSLKGLSFGKISFSNIIRIIVMTLGLIPFISIVNSISTIFVDNKVTKVVNILNVNPLWLNLILLALVPAVCEEYIFRGLIFNGYKKRNPFGAILMSSLLFGLLHMNVNQFIYAVIMGFVFCMLVHATGTIISSIIAHFIFNGFNVTVSYFADDIISRSGQNVEDITISTMDYVISYSMLLALAAIGIAVSYRLFKSICNTNRGFINVKRIFLKENRKSYQEDQGHFLDVYICVGIFLCVLFMVLYS